MKNGGSPLPVRELKSFLKSLSGVTGLSFSFVPAGSDSQELIVGESSFCLRLKGTEEGARRCRAFTEELVARAVGNGKPEFDLCHARMGQMAVPLRSPEGIDYGTVLLGQAVIEEMTSDHRDLIRTLASEISPGEEDWLLTAAKRSPVWQRSRLEALGSFVRDQLLEKALSRGTLEDTTEYLFEKYEELMFLYAITDSLSPDSGHQKALTVILDKGLQKLSARWGLFMMLNTQGGVDLEMLETCGDLPWSGRADAAASLRDLVGSCTGPALVLGPGFREDDAGDILLVPFRLRSNKEGFLVFGWREKGMIGDGGLRFSLALARQASSVLYAVQLYKDLAELLFSTLAALSSAIDAKDPYTHGHSQRVAEYAVLAARGMEMGPRFITMLKIAGQLHDFGKIGIREQILGKQGVLTEEEREAMREHPAIGAQILGKFRPFSEIVPGIRHHHERFDGSGYPSGLSGEAIPIIGRIIAVADAFDAMTTTRPYRQRLDNREALLELRKSSGSQFDPEVVDAFVNSIGKVGHER